MSRWRCLGVAQRAQVDSSIAQRFEMVQKMLMWGDCWDYIIILRISWIGYYTTTYTMPAHLVKYRFMRSDFGGEDPLAPIRQRFCKLLYAQRVHTRFHAGETAGNNCRTTERGQCDVCLQAKNLHGCGLSIAVSILDGRNSHPACTASQESNLCGLFPNLAAKL